MEITEYCRSHQVGFHQPSRAEFVLHQKFIDEIIETLPRLLMPPFSVFQEVSFKEGDGKNDLGSADLVVLHSQVPYLFEGKVLTSDKVHGARNIRNEIRKQLKTARQYFQDHFGRNVRCVGLYKEAATHRVYAVTRLDKMEISLRSLQSLDKILY